MEPNSCASSSAVRSPTKRMPRPISTRARPARFERFDFLHQRVRRFFRKAVEGGQLFLGQLVEIGDAVHQAAIEQLLHHRFAQSLDIHHLAAAKVEQALAQLGRAVRVDAAVVHLALGADDARFRTPDRPKGKRNDLCRGDGRRLR